MTGCAPTAVDGIPRRLSLKALAYMSNMTYSGASKHLSKGTQQTPVLVLEVCRKRLRRYDASQEED